MPSVWHQFLGKSRWVGRSSSVRQIMLAQTTGLQLFCMTEICACVVHAPLDVLYCSVFPSLCVWILKKVSDVSRHAHALLLSY